MESILNFILYFLIKLCCFIQGFFSYAKFSTPFEILHWLTSWLALSFCRGILKKLFPCFLCYIFAACNNTAAIAAKPIIITERGTKNSNSLPGSHSRRLIKEMSRRQKWSVDPRYRKLRSILRIYVILNLIQVSLLIYCIAFCHILIMMSIYIYMFGMPMIRINNEQFKKYDKLNKKVIFFKIAREKFF